MPGFFLVGGEDAAFSSAPPLELPRMMKMRKRKQIFCPRLKFGTCIAHAKVRREHSSSRAVRR